MSLFKSILKHFPKYLTGSGITAATTLVMTKYYTSEFSPAEFGVLALYLVMFKYVMTFASLNLDSGSTRLYFDYHKTKRDEYLSTIFWFITLISAFVIIIALVCIDFISSWISLGSNHIYLITLFTAISGVYVSFLIRILYNEQKSTSVLKHTIFQTLVNHSFSVLFISVFNLGIIGRMGGQGISYLLNSLTLFKEFSRENLFRLNFTFNKGMARETFFLTLPSLIGSIQSIAFIYLDRIFLKYFIGDSAVGVYSLGYFLGQGLSIVYEAIAQALFPKMINDLTVDYDKARNELESFSYKYYIGLVILTITISAFSTLIVQMLSNNNYHDAGNVMPYVMAGFMMGGFYKIPSIILSFHKVVWFYPILSFFSFGINALLNWLLIPIYGIAGAAFTSFIGLFLYSFILQIMCFKYMSKTYRYKIILSYLIIFIVTLLRVNN